MLPNDKILDWSLLEVFVDDKINVTHFPRKPLYMKITQTLKLKFVMERSEIFLEKANLLLTVFKGCLKVTQYSKNVSHYHSMVKTLQNKTYENIVVNREMQVNIIFPPFSQFSDFLFQIHLYSDKFYLDIHVLFDLQNYVE